MTESPRSRPTDECAAEAATPRSDDADADADEQLAALLEGLTAELRAGRLPNLAEAAAAHPHLADELRRLWPAVLIAEEMGINADSFGGSGLGNFGEVESVPIPSHGRLHSLVITLPPLAAVWFTPPG